MGLKEEFGSALERVRPFLGERPQFNISEGFHLMSIGDLAGALPIAENALARLPDSSFTAGVLNAALFALNEFDRVADMPKGRPGWRIQALRYLGRVEEASMVARQWLETTRLPHDMIELLGNSGQHEALISFIEDRWGSLDTFHYEQVNEIGFGYQNMIYIARACQATGRMAEFEQAMGLIRADHDRQAAAGINWAAFFLMEAQYWTMANDHDLAISFVEKSVNDHVFINPKISRMHPILKPLDGDPRFEAVQAKILIHLNQERAEAGLEPLETGNTL
jgi:tetratricopeptide (TPR) repeat protein